MTDYLQPVGRTFRVISVVACSFASIICFILALLLWTDMFRKKSFTYNGKPLWIGAAIVVVIGFAAAFIAGRLVRLRTAPNGITVIRTWFIQSFGLVFFTALC